MDLFDRIAELIGYGIIAIVALGVCGTAAAYVSELIRRDGEDQYPEYGWSREIPHHNSLWDQIEQDRAREAGAGAPKEGV